MHAAPTAVQVDPSPEGQFDPLGKFTAHRRYNRPITAALMSDADTQGIGRQIAHCGTRLGLEIPMGDIALGEPLLRSARLCNRRLCPFCEWRRTRALRARLIAGLNGFQAVHPNYRGLFLTLTMRNCQLSELRETIRHMHTSLKRLQKVAIWPTDLWFRRTEITVSRYPDGLHLLGAPGTTGVLPPMGGGAIQSVHPHMHLLLLVRPSYFSHGYVKQLRWQQEWQMAARLDYPPVVDVRTAKTKHTDDHLHGVAPVSAVVEAAKYASKATDLLALGDDLPEFHWQVKGVRLHATSKALRQFVDDSNIAGDELLDTSTFPVPCISPSLHAVADWFADAQEYRFTI